MTTQEAISLLNNYLQANHKQRTIDSYDYLLSRFEKIYTELTKPNNGCCPVASLKNVTEGGEIFGVNSFDRTAYLPI